MDCAAEAEDVTTPMKALIQKFDTVGHKPSPVFNSPGRPPAGVCTAVAESGAAAGSVPVRESGTAAGSVPVPDSGAATAGSVAAPDSIVAPERAAEERRALCAHCHDAKGNQVAAAWLRSSEKRQAEARRIKDAAVREARAVLTSSDGQGTIESVLSTLERADDGTEEMVRWAISVLREAAEREIAGIHTTHAAHAQSLEQQLRQLHTQLSATKEEARALETTRVGLEQQLQAEKQERKALEEKAGEEKQKADEDRESIRKRYEEVLDAHRDALNWLGAVCNAAPTPQGLEDKAAGARSDDVTVVIRHTGPLGIQFTSDAKDRTVVSEVDTTSCNATDSPFLTLQKGQQLLSVQSRPSGQRNLDSCKWAAAEEQVRTERPLVLTFAPPVDVQVRAQLQMVPLPPGFPRACTQVENIKSMEAQVYQACACAKKIRGDLEATRRALAGRVRVVRLLQALVKVKLPIWRARKQKLLTDRPDQTTHKYRCLTSTKLRQAPKLDSPERGQIAAGDIVPAKRAQTHRVTRPGGEMAEWLCIVNVGAGSTAVRGHVPVYSKDKKLLFERLDGENIPNRKATPSRRPRQTRPPKQHSQICRLEGAGTVASCDQLLSMTASPSCGESTNSAIDTTAPKSHRILDIESLANEVEATISVALDLALDDVRTDYRCIKVARKREEADFSSAECGQVEIDEAVSVAKQVPTPTFVFSSAECTQDKSKEVMRLALCPRGYASLRSFYDKPLFEDECSCAEREIRARLERAGAQTGAIRLSLMWDNRCGRRDVALHVCPPEPFKEINSSNRQSGSGYLDVLRSMQTSVSKQGALNPVLTRTLAVEKQTNISGLMCA